MLASGRDTASKSRASAKNYNQEQELPSVISRALPGSSKSIDDSFIAAPVEEEDQGYVGEDEVILPSSRLTKSILLQSLDVEEDVEGYYSDEEVPTAPLRATDHPDATRLSLNATGTKLEMSPDSLALSDEVPPFRPVFRSLPIKRLQSHIILMGPPITLRYPRL